MLKYFCDGCDVETPPAKLHATKILSSDLGLHLESLAMNTRFNHHYCNACHKRLLNFVRCMTFNATTQTVNLTAAEPTRVEGP